MIAIIVGMGVNDDAVADVHHIGGACVGQFARMGWPEGEARHDRDAQYRNPASPILSGAGRHGKKPLIVRRNPDPEEV